MSFSFPLWEHIWGYNWVWQIYMVWHINIHFRGRVEGYAATRRWNLLPCPKSFRQIGRRMGGLCENLSGPCRGHFWALVWLSYCPEYTFMRPIAQQWTCFLILGSSLSLISSGNSLLCPLMPGTHISSLAYCSWCHLRALPLPIVGKWEATGV